MEEHKGTILHDELNLDYKVKLEAQESELHGLNSGRIIKLEIKRNDRTTFLYDHGIVTEAQDIATILAVALLINKYK